MAWRSVNAPHSARRCPLGAPAGLVHVQCPRATHALQQIALVGVRERVGDSRQDRVDRSGANPGPEELLAQLDHVAPRDTVAHRRAPPPPASQPRPERAARHRGRQRGAALASPQSGQRTLALMLGHRRPPTAATPRPGGAPGSRPRPVRRARTRGRSRIRCGQCYDHLVDRADRQKLAAFALMARLLRPARRLVRPVVP